MEKATEARRGHPRAARRPGHVDTQKLTVPGEQVLQSAPQGISLPLAARNHVTDLTEIGRSFPFLIRDRDTTFTASLPTVLTDTNLRVLTYPKISAHPYDFGVASARTAQTSSTPNWLLC